MHEFKGPKCPNQGQIEELNQAPHLAHVSGRHQSQLLFVSMVDVDVSSRCYRLTALLLRCQEISDTIFVLPTIDCYFMRCDGRLASSLSETRNDNISVGAIHTPMQWLRYCVLASSNEEGSLVLSVAIDVSRSRV